MGHLRLTVRSQGSEQRAGQLQSPHPLPDLTWCISGSQHQCQPLTGNQWSHPGQNPEPAQRRVVTGKAQSPRAGCLLLKQPPARLQAWSPLPEARPDHSCGLPGGLCRKAGALGLKHHMHFSLLVILTQAKLPALPWPGWRSLKKKKQQLFAGLCYIIRCWTPAPESSPKYCCSSQLRWVMSVLGTVCTGSEFPFRGTCLSQSSHEKVGQHLTFFFKYTHI